MKTVESGLFKPIECKFTDISFLKEIDRTPDGVFYESKVKGGLHCGLLFARQNGSTRMVLPCHFDSSGFSAIRLTGRNREEFKGKIIIWRAKKGKESLWFRETEEGFCELPFEGTNVLPLSETVFLVDLKKIKFLDDKGELKGFDLPTDRLPNHCSIALIPDSKNILFVYKEENDFICSVIINYITGEEICRVKM